MDWKDEPTLGKAFKAWRSYHRYRLIDAEKVTKVPMSSIRRIERDDGAPQLKNLALVARALDMSTDEIIARWFTDDDDKQKDQ